MSNCVLVVVSQIERIASAYGESRLNWSGFLILVGLEVVSFWTLACIRHGACSLTIHITVIVPLRNYVQMCTSAPAWLTPAAPIAVLVNPRYVILSACSLLIGCFS